MNLKYTSLSEQSESSIQYHVQENGHEIGTVEGYLTKDSTLVTVVHVREPFQGRGYGFEMFKAVFDKLSTKMIIHTIAGSWNKDEEFVYCEDQMSTNLKIFLDCIEHGGSKEICAKATPTGKWASKLGFTNVLFNKISQTEVSISFSK